MLKKLAEDIETETKPIWWPPLVVKGTYWRLKPSVGTWDWAKVGKGMVVQVIQ